MKYLNSRVVRVSWKYQWWCKSHNTCQYLEISCLSAIFHLASWNPTVLNWTNFIYAWTFDKSWRMCECDFWIFCTSLCMTNLINSDRNLSSSSSSPSSLSSLTLSFFNPALMLGYLGKFNYPIHILVISSLHKARELYDIWSFVFFLVPALADIFLFKSITLCDVTNPKFLDLFVFIYFLFSCSWTYCFLA